MIKAFTYLRGTKSVFQAETRSDYLMKVRRLENLKWGIRLVQVQATISGNSDISSAEV